jgi:hypothetical protein
MGRNWARIFYPCVYVADDLASGMLVALTVHDLKPLYRESELVWLPHEIPLSAAAQSFIAYLQIQSARLGVEVLPVAN